MERAFEELFHDEFVFKRTDGGSKLDKEALRQFMSFFLSIGTKAKVLDFVSLDSAHFEAKVHFENSIANVVSHSRGEVKDGKVIWLEACTDARPAYGQLEHAFDIARMIQNMPAEEQERNINHLRVLSITMLRREHHYNWSTGL